MSRLTATQYRNTLRDILGEDVVLPQAPEPDEAAGGFIAVGASRTSVSPLGVERFEEAAYNLAAQVMDEPARRERLVPCSPTAVTDDACAEQFVTTFGLRAWRRPLAADEVTKLVEIARASADALNDFWDGLEFAMAAILQSPNFLFRVELGTDGAYDDFEMASRLSFFLWNTTPDAALLAAAAKGELTDDAGLIAHVERLVADERAKVGVRNFFTELYHLYELDELVKDPNLFTHFSAEIGATAREETLRVIEDMVFSADSDYRDLFTEQKTFVDRRLASIYSVRAPARDGYGVVELPESGRRRGLLGHASILSLYAHPVASSATKRGHFVRHTILCGTVPPPPVNVNTALPEPSGNAVTLRDRVQEHLTNPACAGCHQLMDPIGLGLEQFDGLGRKRMKENGAHIDASGELDGIAFADAWELGEVVRNHPDLAGCLVRGLYRYATQDIETESEKDAIAWLTRTFAKNGHKVKGLLTKIATSDGFRRAGEVQ